MPTSLGMSERSARSARERSPDTLHLLPQAGVQSGSLCGWMAAFTTGYLAAGPLIQLDDACNARGAYIPVILARKLEISIGTTTLDQRPRSTVLCFDPRQFDCSATKTKLPPTKGGHKKHTPSDDPGLACVAIGPLRNFAAAQQDGRYPAHRVADHARPRRRSVTEVLRKTTERRLGLFLTHCSPEPEVRTGPFFVSSLGF